MDGAPTRRIPLRFRIINMIRVTLGGERQIMMTAARDQTLQLPHRWSVRPFKGDMMETRVGSFAAFCTTVSYRPEVKKCWTTGSANDFSRKMFLMLALGIAPWAVYDVMNSDVVIIAANAISLSLLGIILYLRLRRGT